MKYNTMSKCEISLPFKKIHDHATLPYYATDGSAGMDSYTVSGPIIDDMFIKYELGFAVQIPKGYVGLLFPRSSVSKKDLILANSVGVIDSDYRGEVQARFKTIYLNNTTRKIMTDNSDIYKKGDAVCQLFVIPVPELTPKWVDELSDTERGDGGFGSTNK